jgi:SAM-dependent methyltransferase
MHEKRPRMPGFTVREQYYNRVLPKDFDPKVIVDVGALYDSVSWLRERFPSAHIIALNIMPVHLDSVPDEWAEKHLGAAESLPNLGEVDLIFLGEVIEHLVYPQEFLARAVQLLKLDGRILISTPNLASWHNRLLMLFGYSPSNYSMIPGMHLGIPPRLARIAGLGYGDHIRVFTYKALEELFDTAPWKLDAITSAAAVQHNRPMHRVRNGIDAVLPRSARESVFLCARLVSKQQTERIDSTGWIGNKAPVPHAR